MNIKKRKGGKKIKMKVTNIVDSVQKYFGKRNGRNFLDEWIKDSSGSRQLLTTFGYN